VLGPPFGCSSSAGVPLLGTPAELQLDPMRPRLRPDRPANARQRETEIDTLITPGSAGRARLPGSPPTWLVLADNGQPVLGDAASGVATVSLGSTFVRLLHELRPALAVVWSPPAAPVELLAAVAERRQRPGLRLIFLNEPGDVTGRLEALALGFDEALPASVDPAELAGRAHLLLDAGRHGADPDRNGADAARHVPVAHDVQLDLVGRRVRRHGTDVHLRPKEFALLALLATDPGRVFSRQELVDRIWGPTYTGGARTVDVHIRWLRAKIEDEPARPVHVITVRGTGYRLDPPEA
jgi:DNA-binding response OmpR family regulator